MVSIDADGDLLLDVGGDEDTESPQLQRFRVCSSTLRRHSPVWKKMLFGPWKESKPNKDEYQDWIVEFPDDPVKPMEIVLNIIHGHFDQVPRSLSLDELYQLLILTHKYDMTRTLRLLCAQWVTVAHGDLSSADTLKSMFIAWELGDQDLFALRVEEISMHTSAVVVVRSGSLFGASTTKFCFRKSNLAGAAVVGDQVLIDLQSQIHLGPHNILG